MPSKEDLRPQTFYEGQGVTLMVYGHECEGTVVEVLRHPNPDKTPHYLVEFEDGPNTYKWAFPDYRLDSGP